MNGRGVLIQNICYHVPENQVLLTAAGKVDAIINDPVIISRISLISRTFRLTFEKPGQDEEFLAAVKTGLKEVSENGVSSDLFHAVLKENRLSDCLTREAPHLGFHISEEIGKYWSTTDKTGYFTLYENCFDTFFQEEKQDE